jgi:hypothetical protein
MGMTLSGTEHVLDVRPVRVLAAREGYVFIDSSP